MLIFIPFTYFIIPSVGKDALVQQFVYRQFKTNAIDNQDTIHKKNVPVDEKQVSVEFFPIDHPKQMIDALNGSECDGCLAVYDISSTSSFEALKSLISMFITLFTLTYSCLVVLSVILL